MPLNLAIQHFPTLADGAGQQFIRRLKTSRFWLRSSHDLSSQAPSNYPEYIVTQFMKKEQSFEKNRLSIPRYEKGSYTPGA